MTPRCFRLNRGLVSWSVHSWRKPIRKFGDRFTFHGSLQAWRRFFSLEHGAAPRQSISVGGQFVISVLFVKQNSLIIFVLFLLSKMDDLVKSAP